MKILGILSMLLLLASGVCRPVLADPPTGWPTSITISSAGFLATNPGADTTFETLTWRDDFQVYANQGGYDYNYVTGSPEAVAPALDLVFTPGNTPANVNTGTNLDLTPGTGELLGTDLNGGLAVDGFFTAGSFSGQYNLDFDGSAHDSMAFLSGGNAGNSVASFQVPSTVPEPAGVAMALPGVILLLCRRDRMSWQLWSHNAGGSPS